MMKLVYIILGVWIAITGILTMTGVMTMDQVTAGMYVTCLGVITLTEGFGMWGKRKKDD